MYELDRSHSRTPSEISRQRDMMFIIAPDKSGHQECILFLHRNMLWVLIRNASVSHNIGFRGEKRRIVKIFGCIKHLTVKVLKVWTLFFFFFELLWPKLCFLCSCFLKYLVEWQANSVDLEQSALFACAILSETLVFKVLGHSPFLELWFISIQDFQTYTILPCTKKYQFLERPLNFRSYKRQRNGNLPIFSKYP